MNPRNLFLCSFTTALFIALPVFAGNGRNGGGGHASMSRSAPRGGAIQAGARFAGMNRAGAGNFRRFNNATGVQRINNWNGNRNGNQNWNGNRHWANGNNWNGRRNWNGNWNRHCGNGFVFIGGFGYPWFDPFYYGSYYPYGYGYGGYGAYQGDYLYNSDYSGQPYSGDDGNGSYYNDGKNPVNGGYTTSNGSMVAQVQRRLARDGYYQGSIDGRMGSRTFYAIRAYERAHGLPVDGQIDRQLLSKMGLG
jgi:Putative peptidoglycan binding domain